MRKKMKRTLAILLALAMMLGDNAVVFATESTENAAEAVETVDAAAEDANEAEDASVDTNAAGTEADDAQAEEAESDGEDGETEASGEGDAAVAEGPETAGDADAAGNAEDAADAEETEDATEEEIIVSEEASEELPKAAADAEETYAVTVQAGYSGEVIGCDSFDEAISAVNEFSTDEEIFITVYGAQELSASATISQSWNDITLKAGDENASLDFKGNTLSVTAYWLSIYDLPLVNTGSKNGTLSLSMGNTISKSTGDYIMPSLRIYATVSDDTEATGTVTLVDGVDLTDTRGYVRFIEQSESSSFYTSGLTYSVNSTITSYTVEVYSGYWTVGDVISNELELENSITAFTAKNITLSSGYLYAEHASKMEVTGTLKMSNTSLQIMSEAEATIEKLSVSTKSNSYDSSWGTIYNQGTLQIGELDMAAGTFTNYGYTYIKKITKIANLKNVSETYNYPDVEDTDSNLGGHFICGNFTQLSTATTTFYGDSTFAVTGSASSTIYNVTLAAPLHYIFSYESYEFELDTSASVVSIYRGVDTSLAFNTKFAQADTSVTVEFGEIEELTVDTGTIVPGSIESGEVLFSTNISSFPSDLISVGETDLTVTRSGNNLVAVASCIYIIEGDDPTAEAKKGFGSWSDAVTYLNKRSDTSMTYTVRLTESIDVGGALTLPSKVGELIIYGNGADDEEISLTYQGSLSLATNLCIQNLILEGGDSALKLNGKTLTLSNVTQTYFASVSGTGRSAMELTDGSEVSVGGALTTVDLMFEDGSVISAGGAVKVTGTLTMEDGSLYCGNSVTLANVVSNSDRNEITYGNYRTACSLSISGTVSSDDPAMMAESTIAEGVCVGAIEVRSNYFESKSSDSDEIKEYYTGKKLLTAAKASSSWFVSQKEYSYKGETSIGLVTHKDGTAILGGACSDAKASLWTMGAEVVSPNGSFASLQDAFTEINNLNNAEAVYQIYLMDDVTEGTLTWPSKTAMVMLYANEYENYGGETRTLAYSGSMTLKCQLGLMGVVLKPTTKSSKINIGNYDLCIYGGGFSGDYATSVAVSGSGVGGASRFKLVNTDMTLSSLQNVGNLILLGSDLEVRGTIKVGDVQSYARMENGEKVEGSTLTGTATVKKSTVTPSITISGAINEGSTEVDNCFRDSYEQDSLTLKLLDSADSTKAVEFAACTAPVKLAKAANAGTKWITFSSENYDGGESSSIIKTVGYLAWTNGTVTTELYALTDDGELKLADCLSFADAVSEINTRKDSGADYMIELLADIGTENAPMKLTLPNAKTAKSVTIDGSGKTVYCMNAIRLNTSTEFANVKLVPLKKSGTTYGSAAPDVTMAASGLTLCFAEGAAMTVEGHDEALVFRSLSCAGGTLALAAQTAYVEGAVNVGNLSANGASLTSEKAMKLTNVSGTGVTLGAYCSKANVTQLTISGTIDADSVTIIPYKYADGTYSPMTADDEAGMIVGAQDTPGQKAKLATLKKGSTENIRIRFGENVSSSKLFKYNSGLYLTSADIPVQVKAYSDAYMTETYLANFLSWSQAVSEINTIKDKSAYYEIVLQKDLGIEEKTGGTYEMAPLSGLTMPTWAAEVTVTSSDEDAAAIFFTGSAVKPGCSTVFDNIGLFAVKGIKKNGSKYYSSTTYALKVGSCSLTERTMRQSITFGVDRNYTLANADSEQQSLPGAFTGSTKGTLSVDTMSAVSVSGFGTVIVDKELTLSGAFKSTNLTLNEGSVLKAKNVTVTGTTTLNGAKISSGTTVVGDGTIKLANVVVGSDGNYLEGKLNKKGSSLVSVTGVVSLADGVTDDCSITVCLRDSMQSGYAQLYNGMTLLTAPKADSSWFRVDTEMMGADEGYILYKSGTAVKYSA